MGIIPVGTSGYPVRKPRVTYAIIAINVIIYIVTSYKNFFISTSEEWINRFALIPALLLNASQWYRFITSMFLHADLFHILFNMYFLYIFGKEVESILGHTRYLVLYMLSGFAASIFHTAYTPIVGLHMTIVPALGASGAISGVLGAYLLLFPHRRMTICWFLWIMPWCFTTIASYYLIFWFALQVIYGYARLGSIAFFAHAGGFVAGMAVLGFIKPKIFPYLVRPIPVPPWYYDGANGFYEPYYHEYYFRRGLGSTAKFILLLLLLALMTGSMYSIIASAHMKGSIYLMDISVRSDEIEVSDVAVYSVDRGVIIAPTKDEPRIVLNRLNWAGLLEGKPNAVIKEYSFDGIIPTAFKGISVRLKLYCTIEYDEHGVMRYSAGRMVTDVLQIMPGYRIYLIRDQEFVYELHSSEIASNIGPVLIFPSALLSVLISAIAAYVVYAKDRELVIE